MDIFTLLGGYMLMFDIGILATFVLIAFLIFRRSLASSERMAARELEFKKFLVERGVLQSNPETFVQLEKLYRDYHLVLTGFKWGWIPFLLMVNAVTIQVKATPTSSPVVVQSVLPVVFTVGLVLFYGMLLRQAVKISGRITEKELTIRGSTTP